MFSLEVENETAPLFDGPFLSANTWKHSMSEKAISPSIQIPIEARRWSLFGIAGVSPHPDEPFGLPRWEGSYAGETRCRGRLSMVSRLEVGGKWGLQQIWEWISGLGFFSYGYFVGRLRAHFEQSHWVSMQVSLLPEAFSKGVTWQVFFYYFCQWLCSGWELFNVLLEWNLAFHSYFLSTVAASQSQVGCYCTPAGLLLETWRCRGRCFLPAGRWLCEGSLKHQRRVALSRRPRREVAFEGWKLKGEGVILGVRLFMGTVAGFRVRDRFKWMYIAHSMQYIFFWSCFYILCKDSFILVWAYPNCIPNPMGGLMRQVFSLGKPTPSEMLSKMFESSHIRAMYTGSQDVAPKSAGRRTTTGQAQ